MGSARTKITRICTIWETAFAAIFVLSECLAATVAPSTAQIDAILADVADLKLKSAQLAKDVATLSFTNEGLQKEVQVLKASSKSETKQIIDTASADKKELEKQLKSAESLVEALARQVSTQQLFVEERIRSDGHSGIKRCRGGRSGTKAYHAGSVVSGTSALSIHDHSNYDRTAGLGEFIAVLNGVEFRTRHNDYKLVMPSMTSKVYQATQPITYPEVPPEVLAKKNVSDQIVEMREWFRAWKLQDTKKRDYRKYFKPALCYLEGSWTHSTASVDEPFESDRHAIDAKSWFELQEKIDFTSHTGGKSSSENYAFLPTRIVNLVNNSIPMYAQWNYRILCHPLSFDLPTNILQPVDDFATRMKLNLRYDQFATTRAARYQVGPDVKWSGEDKSYNYKNILDKIMKEIPGVENYGGNIVDDVMFSTSLTPGSSNKEVLNAAYYYRWSSSSQTDAMGQSLRSVGFNDAHLYVAQTNQPKVVAKAIDHCHNKTTCKTFSQRITYAIPLEIIYMTPLLTWNPHNLPRQEKTATVTGNYKRDGRATLTKAYNGTSSKYHYLTPVEFFTGDEVEQDAADTTKSVSVLNSNGTAMHSVTASGIRILFPEIPGVGILRQRYPIFPVHEEGSHTYMEVEALKDMLMDQSKYVHLFRNPPGALAVAAANTTSTTQKSGVTLVTSISKISPHEHLLDLSPDEIEALHKGEFFEQFSSEANGHSHLIKVSLNPDVKAKEKYIMILCDGKTVCWDGHDAIRLDSN